MNMRELIPCEIHTISGAAGDELVPGCNTLTLPPDFFAKPDFHTPGIAVSLLFLTVLFNTAATATLKPAIPLWGAPVTLSFGLVVGGTVLLLGQGIDWLHSSNANNLS